MLPRSCRALHLFAAGMLLLPAFLFQPSLELRLLQMVLFAILARLAGKRIRWLYFLLVCGSIVLFNLFSPIGRVLARIGPLAITSGALRLGLQKGITIIGLVFVSLFSIRADLRIGGNIGGVVARMFFYFERIMEQRRRISRRHIIADIDTILETTFASDEATTAPQQADSGPQRTTPFGWVCLTALLLGNWGLLAIGVRVINGG